MCKWTKNGNKRIDHCMRSAIKSLSIIFKHCNMKILACCCGHGKYPPSIVYQIPKYNNAIFEVFSGLLISRKTRFYKRDKQGYFYIPEVCNARNRQAI